MVAGVDVMGDPIGVRNRIGLGGQHSAVDDFLTGRENVVMVGRLYNLTRTEAERRADEVLASISLTDAANRPVRTYSGGMRRRLDLAASLVGRPEVLFLDEPTTGIDPRSRIEIWGIIEGLVKEGTTLLLTTQYLEEADYLADNIGVIDNGQLIAEGSPDTLKDTIGGSMIELHVDAADRERATGVLDTLSDTDPMFDETRELLVIPATDGSRSLIEVVRAMDDAEIPIVDIQLHKPTLDDVFLTLTGHSTDVEDQEPEPATRGRGKR
jgi:ABC-2 type transport system ATP-binding protein